MLSACATEREVAVLVPLSRMELPEAGARSIGIGVGAAGAIRAELTQDQTTTAPDPKAPTLEHETTGQLRFDWLMAPQLQVSLRNWGRDLSGGQLKWYAVQPRLGSALSMAVTVGYGAARENFDFDGLPEDSHTHFRQTLADLGVVFGIRVDKNVLLFGGPFASRNRYRGHYFSARGSNPDVDQDFSGHINLTGVNLGIAYSPRNWFTLAGEVSSAQVQAGDVQETPVEGTLLAQFNFGPRTRAPEQAEPPVEIVPPIERDEKN